MPLLSKILISGMLIAVAAGASVYFGVLAIAIVIALIALIGVFLFVLEKPWVGVLLVGFFLPFERIGGFDVIGATTLKVGHVAALIAIIAWLLHILTHPKEKIAPNSLFWPIATFLAVNIVSFYNAENLSRAIVVFIFLLFAVVFSLIMPQLIRGEKVLKKVILAVLISAVLVSLFGLFQFTGDVVGLPTSITGLREHYTKAVFGFPRIHSTALEPLYFANYLLIPISIAVMLFLIKKPVKSGSVEISEKSEEKKERLIDENKEKLLSENNGKLSNEKAEIYENSPSAKIQKFLESRFFYFCVFGLGIIALVLTLSRGGFLGLAFVLILVFITGFKLIFKPRNIVIIAGAFLIAVLLVSSFLYYSGRLNADIFLEQAASYKGGAGVSERYEMYGEALRAFKKHPIIGIGVGNFGPFVSLNPYHMPEEGWAIVNNETLEIMAETGVLGLAAFALVLAVLISRQIMSIIRSRKFNDRYLWAINVGLLIAFIAILVQYQTFSTLYLMHFWFLIGLMVAVQNITNEKAMKSN